MSRGVPIEAKVMADGGGKPFTMFWKAAVVVAVIGDLARDGAGALANKPERRQRDQERRINELERKVRDL